MVDLVLPPAHACPYQVQRNAFSVQHCIISHDLDQFSLPMRQGMKHRCIAMCCSSLHRAACLLKVDLGICIVAELEQTPSNMVSGKSV